MNPDHLTGTVIQNFYIVKVMGTDVNNEPDQTQRFEPPPVPPFSRKIRIKHGAVFYSTVRWQRRGKVLNVSFIFIFEMK
jgi:hypothetical protein